MYIYVHIYSEHCTYNSHHHTNTSRLCSVNVTSGGKAMADLQHVRAVPELYESALGECLAARTKSLAKYAVSLGPPDLCHVTKVQSWVEVIDHYHVVQLGCRISILR